MSLYLQNCSQYTDHVMCDEEIETRLQDCRVSH